MCYGFVSMHGVPGCNPTLDIVIFRVSFFLENNQSLKLILHRWHNNQISTDLFSSFSIIIPQVFQDPLDRKIPLCQYSVSQPVVRI